MSAGRSPSRYGRARTPGQGPTSVRVDPLRENDVGGLLTSCFRIGAADVMLDGLVAPAQTAIDNVIANDVVSLERGYDSNCNGELFEHSLFLEPTASRQAVIDLPGAVSSESSIQAANNVCHSSGKTLHAQSVSELRVRGNVVVATLDMRSAALRFEPGAYGVTVAGNHVCNYESTDPDDGFAGDNGNCRNTDVISCIPWAIKPNGNLQVLGFGRSAVVEAHLNRVDRDDERRGKEADEIPTADVITISDLGSDYAVKLIAAGQWLEYSIDVKLGGTYNIDFRLASGKRVVATFHLMVDGADVTGRITLPETGEWSTWRTLTKTGFSLAPWQHILRFGFDGNGSAAAVADFNYFRLVRIDLIGAATPKPAAPSDLAVTAVSASRIDLTWTDNSNNTTGFKIERALRGQTYATIATCPAGSTSYSDTGLNANTKYYYRIRAANAGGNSAASEPARTTTPAEVELPPSPPPSASDSIEETSEHTTSLDPLPASPSDASLPVGWSTTHVGPSANSRSACYVDGSFIVGGAGSDIWGRSDGFCFVYHSLDGDGQIVARVVGLPRTNLAAKAGVMIRQTLDANSTHVGLFVTPAAGLRFLRRLEAGGATTNTVKTDNRAIAAPCWLKLERRGVTIIAYRSADGRNWQLVGSDFIALSKNIHVGLAVTSHMEGTTNVSTFDNVSILSNQSP